MSSSGRPSLGLVPNNARYKRLQELQNHFCRDDGRIVWEKMGFRDIALSRATFGLCIVGVAYSMYSMYKMTKGKQ